MFNADFELKRIPGTDPNSEYFVVTETNGYTVGVKPFLAITPQGVVTLGLRVRANGDDPEEAAETLGLNLSSIDKIVLSHGHYDHTGGLREMLGR